MAQYLIALHHRDGDDPFSVENDEIQRSVEMLNEEMIAAGIRIFVGCLRPASAARSLCVNEAGEVAVSAGAYQKTPEHMGGFWVVEAASFDDALRWGRKAAATCRAPVEVRPFFEMS
jgi:hypothetical protein